jgi:predicted alpha/beta hydrolase
MTRVDGKVLIPVSKSSHLIGLGYDPQASKAFVEYSTGAVWEYWPVKRNEWAMIAMSPSKGTAVHAALKRNPHVHSARVEGARVAR